MKSTKKIALCGVFGALSIVVMLMGSIIPFATYACPAIAAFLLLPVVDEYGEKSALTLYTAVSLLSLMLIAEKEFVLMYVCVFGLYTVFKFKADKIKPKLLQIFFKGLYGFLSTLLTYAVLIFVFPNPLLMDEFGGTGLIIAFFVIFVITFLLYDTAAKIGFILYKIKLKPRLMGKK